MVLLRSFLKIDGVRAEWLQLYHDQNMLLQAGAETPEWSEHYATIHGLISRATSRLQPETVIDLGHGFGHHLPDNFACDELILVDLDERALRAEEERLTARNLFRRVGIEVADVSGSLGILGKFANDLAADPTEERAMAQLAKMQFQTMYPSLKSLLQADLTISSLLLPHLSHEPMKLLRAILRQQFGEIPASLERRVQAFYRDFSSRMFFNHLMVLEEMTKPDGLVLIVTQVARTENGVRLPVFPSGAAEGLALISNETQTWNWQYSDTVEYEVMSAVRRGSGHYEKT